MNNVGKRSRLNRQVRRPVVLVVEDDVLIRLNAVEVLQNAGYWTLESATADAAIKILESHPEIAVVFSDVEMPGLMNGIGLAFSVRASFFRTKILLTSGRRNIEEHQLPQGARFVGKPYTDREIVDTISEMLGGFAPDLGEVSRVVNNPSPTDDASRATSELSTSVKEDNL